MANLKSYLEETKMLSTSYLAQLQKLQGRLNGFRVDCQGKYVYMIKVLVKSLFPSLIFALIAENMYVVKYKNVIVAYIDVKCNRRL